MDYKESFLQYLQIERRYSPNTVRSYLNDLEQFFRFLATENDNPDPNIVTSHDIRSWMVYLMENKYTSKSIHRKVSTLR